MLSIDRWYNVKLFLVQIIVCVEMQKSNVVAEFLFEIQA